MSANKENLIELLNEKQALSVQHVNGPLLILAGAGTGKTKVLITKIANVLLNEFAKKTEILAVTFTNKAAKEMKDRLSELLGENSIRMSIGTFHSVALNILRNHSEVIGLNKNFLIIDDEDQLKILKSVQTSLGIDDKQYSTKNISSKIKSWKDKLISPKNLPLRMDHFEMIVKKVYKEYEEKLIHLNAVDFGNIILHCMSIFSFEKNILEYYQEKFKYIFVDEYQDTNVAQYSWLRALSAKHKNICCVGDDDQSIYGWRGAEINNILRFESDYENAKIIRLEQNYRSSGHIIGAAAGLIEKNERRLSKTLWTKSSVGEFVKLKHLWSTEDESRFVLNEIRKSSSKKDNFSSFAVLVRAIFQTREFEEEFLKFGIPYKILGGLKFYERQEIKDVIAYIRFLLFPDDNFSFERIINVPKRNIGEATLQKIYGIMEEEKISLPRAAKKYGMSSLSKSSQSINLFFNNFENWRNDFSKTENIPLIQKMLNESGYIKMWKEDKNINSSGRLENIRELLNTIAKFDSLEEFIGHVGLMIDESKIENEDAVNIMTLHGAKGLEFDTVFLVGWEEGIIPHQRALSENGEAGLEEERRLAYVGISRAKKNLYITHCSKRRTIYAGWQNSIPSRFIKEIPKSHIFVMDSKTELKKTNKFDNFENKFTFNSIKMDELSKDVSSEEDVQALRKKYKSLNLN